MNYVNDKVNPERRFSQIIVLNEKSLHRILKEFFRYYHDSRTHQFLDMACTTG
jgi:hypothetical protein